MLIPLGVLSQGVADNFWLLAVGTTATATRGEQIHADSSDGFLVIGNTDRAGAGGRDLFAVKTNSQGVIQWQRTLGGAGQEQGWGVSSDSSNNVYFFGDTASAGAGLQDFLLSKYSAAGALQWQRVLGGANDEFGRDVVVDSDNSIIVSGATRFSGGDIRALVAKYDDTGTVQWQRTLHGAQDDFWEGVAVDASNNVFVAGATRSTGPGRRSNLLAKYNTFGTLQWQRLLGSDADQTLLGVAVDSAGDVYVCGENQLTVGGNYQFIVAKYNTSGTLQWQRAIINDGKGSAYKLIFDADDNLYVVGDVDVPFVPRIFIAKYDTAGNIIFQRRLGFNQADLGRGVSIDSKNNLLVSGTLRAEQLMLAAKLPSTGGLTGTYSLSGYNVVYDAGTLSATTPTLTASTPTLTSTNSSLTAATPTLTSAAASINSALVEIG